MATRGRKPQPDAKRKLVVTRFQDVEFNAIENYSKQLGKPVSTFIRELTLSHLEAEGVPMVWGYLFTHIGESLRVYAAIIRTCKF